MVVISTRVVALLVAGAAAWTVGTLFVQPAGGAQAGARTGARSLQQQGFPAMAPEIAESESSQPLNALFLGLALGLVVGFASVGLPGAALAAGEVAPADCDLRLGQTKKECELWAKEKAKIWYQEKNSAKKFQIPTTGAGVYPLKNTNTKLKDDPAQQARIQKLVDSGFLHDSRYGNYYSRSSPFLYQPK
mmetsp:Transcript_117569/g.312774  ORF Transcript_117569/g.312774 Transcript_117569/m.312774 type:complete len:190 (-) Transcript_117569:110-679(-)